MSRNSLYAVIAIIIILGLAVWLFGTRNGTVTTTGTPPAATSTGTSTGQSGTSANPTPPATKPGSANPGSAK